MSDVPAGRFPDKPRSPWADVWRQFRFHRGAMAGVFILAALIAAARSSGGSTRASSSRRRST